MAHYKLNKAMRNVMNNLPQKVKHLVYGVGLLTPDVCDIENTTCVRVQYMDGSIWFPAYAINDTLEPASDTEELAFAGQPIQKKIKSKRNNHILFVGQRARNKA